MKSYDSLNNIFASQQNKHLSVQMPSRRNIDKVEKYDAVSSIELLMLCPCCPIFDLANCGVLWQQMKCFVKGENDE